MNITVFRVYQLNLLTAISMYMKSLFYLFLSIVGAWLFSSCSDDFLGETETTDLDQATVFADSTYTADFLNQIYVDIGFDIQHNRYKDQYNDHGGLQTSCDEAAYKASTGLTTDVMFATGTVNPVTISEDDVWRIAYRNIRRVNVFFKYADGSRMAEAAKEEYKAEARFLRAWYYAMLLRHYGGVALIGDDVYETVEEAIKERNSYADCVEYIVDEANKAAETLPVERSGNKFGRVTRGACKALISRVRLYAASKLFNGSDFAPADFPKELLGYPTYDKERWKIAVDAALDVYKAEARFLRAWYYAMLLRHYGGVALIGDDVYETVEEAIKERNSYADCVEYIVDEANKAAETLPVERSGNKFGRVTRGACKALISRVRLYAASKLFNGSDFAPADFPKELLGYPTYDKERWKIAVDAALDVIKMKQYDLYIRNEDENNEAYPGWGYYAQLLPADYYGKVGTEVYCGTIFEKKAGASIDTNRWFAPPSTGGNGIGGYVYHDLAELFPMADGTPTKDSPDYDPTNPANKRDPRFMFTVTYDGCIMKSNMQDTEINISVGTQQDAIYRGTPTGYYTHKFLKFGSMANQMLYGGSQARPLMRYTEILLNYAEAANEYYGPDHKDVLGDQEISPYIVLRKIRECAGIEPGEDGTYGIKNNMSQADMTEAIRLERRLDLAFEGHRFFDVRRWMIAEDTDNRMMHGFEITRNGERKTGRIIDTRQHTFRKAMYFYPIPYKETVKSPDLLQNPYYE